MKICFVMHVKSATYSGYVRQSTEILNFFFAKIPRKSILLVTDRYGIIKLK